ncbi:MAG: DNA-binding response regulator [Chloroflexi bacterium GWB2_49_20]|nr:MAG: DNA-binding response regulator [Chloroflexi bacterium GWB2_49_20]OGN79898.1 MAG: DNA-binding response regulator [Chloroflexi bacterium GWC2_49_37]OGN85567.1 MAG: DNA-binding response regulator [Chloroflexi bacterium GWD2_49_16]HBG74443.1 DNA-binding response regulator [Anaerolineae bacterium]HCC79590.1 DNA-binding response regulator [Anaerolineae bacterium]
MSKSILIVDDEPRYLHLLEANLRTEDFEVVSAHDGEEAIEIFTSKPTDLILLDVMMPKLDGFSTCQRIRQFSSVPIIILTAKGEEQERVRGLDMGADDYLVKPFSIGELLARVRAVLRRVQPMEGNQSRFFTHGDLRIDQARAEVWRGDQQIYLSATEYRLLLQFSHNLGKVVSAEELLTSVWGSEYITDKEILWVTIARLRQKVEEDSHDPRHIVTRSGLGYIMPPEGTEE